MSCFEFGKQEGRRKAALPPAAPAAKAWPMEIVFSVTQEGDGGYVAECLSHDIFTQGDTWEELSANVREAVAGYFFDQPARFRMSKRA